MMGAVAVPDGAPYRQSKSLGVTSRYVGEVTLLVPIKWERQPLVVKMRHAAAYSGVTWCKLPSVRGAENGSNAQEQQRSMDV
jgi:hypothetical protein